jgi:hypothetical protein
MGYHIPYLSHKFVIRCASSPDPIIPLFKKTARPQGVPLQAELAQWGDEPLENVVAPVILMISIEPLMVNL